MLKPESIAQAKRIVVGNILRFVLIPARVDTLVTCFMQRVFSKLN